MAITLNGVTTDKLGSGMKPSDYTDPTVTTFDDATWTRTVELSVLKSTVEDSDRATTLGNIIDDVGVGIDVQVEGLLADVFDATNTVEAYADITKISSNHPANGGTDSEFLTDTAFSYVVTVDIYAKKTA